MTIYELKNSMSVIGEQLKKVEQEIRDKAANPAITMDEINNLKTQRDDLKARFNLIKEQHDELVAEEEARIKAQISEENGNIDNNEQINIKAEFFKNVINNKPITNNINNSLGGFGSGSNGGEKFLPTNITNQILTEPTVKNPLRNRSTFTNIAGLEIPKINFTIDEYDFLQEDTETAKEIEATGDTVEFSRNKTKIFVPIPGTLMHGTNTNLVETVENALQSGLAKKEKQVAFLPDTDGSSKVGSCESFYKCTPAIKKITATSMFTGIVNALADLEDEFSENATVFMKRQDYYDMIRELANNSTTLYMAQPKEILGCDVEFCEKATKPVVGDFRYSHFNYDPNMVYDRDKNVRTGIYDFVLTAWFDHKIKLKSAFRIVEVTEPDLLTKKGKSNS